jgi:hypothetical protein
LSVATDAAPHSNCQMTAIPCDSSGLWVGAAEVMPRILEVAQIEQLGTDPSSIEWMLQTFREFQRFFVAAGQAGELVMVVKY